MTRSFLLTTALILGLTAPASADIAVPQPPPRNLAITFIVDPTAKAPTVIIPSGPGRRPGPAPAAPSPVSADTEESDAPMQSPLIVGLCLAAAVTLTGLGMARRYRIGGRYAALLLAAGATLIVGAVVWANVPPPPPPAKKGELVSVPGTLQSVQRGEAVQIVLDKDTLAKLVEAAKKQEGK